MASSRCDFMQRKSRLEARETVEEYNGISLTKIRLFYGTLNTRSSPSMRVLVDYPGDGGQGPYNINSFAKQDYAEH